MARIIDQTTNSSIAKNSKGFINGCGLCSIILVLMLIVTTIFGFLQFNNYNDYSISKTTNSESVQFEVREGESLQQITQRMIDIGLIEDKKIIFLPTSQLFLQFNSIDSSKIQAGKHQIPPQTPVLEVYSFLQLKDCEQIKVTFQEGLRVEEFAEALSKQFQGKKGSNFNPDRFIDIARNYTNINNIQLDFMVPNNLEGFLAPDTYNFCIDSTEQQIIDRLLKTFNERVYLVYEFKINQSNYSFEELVNIASLIEREAKTDEQRKMFAGVIENRLKRNEPLGLDVSSQYGGGYNQKQSTWWAYGSELDKLVTSNSPYNLRINEGLPPTPISNFNTKSFESALEPAKHDYLYFIVDENDIGRYARTQAEHERNVCKYLKTNC